MSTARKPVGIIGAGFAGLTAARFLRRHGITVIVFESGRQVAGLASSHVDDRGFRYDFGAHFITNRLANEVGIAGECRDVRYYGESFLVRGKPYSYPFGLMTVPRYVWGGVKAKLSRHRDDEAACTAANWFRSQFGDTLANEVCLPTLEAWAGVPAERLSAAVGQKLQKSMARTIYHRIYGRLKGRAIANGYSHEMPEGRNVWHVYPERGVSQLCERMLGDLPGVVHLESPVEEIFVDEDRAVAVRAAGKVYETVAVVSTMPVPLLPKLVVGSDELQPLGRFRYRPMVFACLRFETRRLLRDTVLWTAGNGLPFFRLTETTRSMPWLAPEGTALITADIGCSVGDTTWAMDDARLGLECVEALESVVPGAKRYYSGCRVLRTPIAYPLYLMEYEADRRRLAHS